MSLNHEWLARSKQSVWHPCTQMKRHETLPIIPIAKGDGIWLEDFDGNRYIDAVSSWWVNLFGHNQPRIKAALHDQLEQLEHVILAGFTHQPVIELSERLAALSGLGHAFYGSDGASATEIALKMSFHYWKNQGQTAKQRFISLENSYHGETMGALAVTDVPIFSSTYAPLLKENIRVSSPDWRQAGSGVSQIEHAHHCADQLATLLANEGSTIAAIILEPLVQGAAGMAMYDPVYLQRVRQLCDQYAIHLIADEIAVGFGRTGTMFAYQQADIRPDFLCLSKGITGGYLPLSCVLSTDQIYDAFYHDEISRGFLHSHSYTGNALACRAALAVLDIFEQDNILERNKETASCFSNILAPIAAHGSVRNFRHCGMIWAFEVVSDRADFSVASFQLALQQGCLLRPIGNTVYIMPPYIIEQSHMLQIRDTCLLILEQLGSTTGTDSKADTVLP